jgi:hypothetical protein
MHAIVSILMHFLHYNPTMWTEAWTGLDGRISLYVWKRYYVLWFPVIWDYCMVMVMIRKLCFRISYW